MPNDFHFQRRSKQKFTTMTNRHPIPEIIDSDSFLNGVDNLMFSEESTSNDHSSENQPRRSMRRTQTMIQPKTSTTDNQSEKIKIKKKRKGTVKYSLVERINNESPANEFFTDEIVFATIPGYCPWPASILYIEGQTLFVKFFGTGQM